MSILTSSTINAASLIRIYHTHHKAAPLTSTQKKERTAQREKNQTAISMAVDEWFSSTTAKANELAARFNKKPRYFLDIFFHGGARMVLKYRKVTRLGIEPRTFWTYTRCSNQLSYPALEFNRLILYFCNCQSKDTYSARHI